VKKLNLILLTLVAALPAAALVYLLGWTLTLKHIWDKKLLGGTVVATGIIALMVVVWPPLWAIAWYVDPSRSKAGGPGGESAEDAEEVAEAEEAGDEEFPEEDLDAFEGEEVAEGGEFKPASTGTEFELDEQQALDVDEDDIEQTATADFDLSDDELMEDFEEIEEEEEAPKKKGKKKKK